MATIEQMAIHPAAQIGGVRLAISNLDRSVHFYTHVIGFRLIERSAHTVTLGVGTTPLLVIEEQTSAQPQPPRTTGLYHFALLVPTRKDLAHSLRCLAETVYSLSGASDHLVSEALYLDDPDGNGIEIYRDRPRETWQWSAGQVKMATNRLDLNAILREAEGDASEWQGLAVGTRVGHIHLRVADLRQAEVFYHETLGCDLVGRLPGALFLSAGGYHHHIGLNTWQSRLAPEPPANAVGLRSFTIEIPNMDEEARVIERLESAGVAIEPHHDGLIVRDPWNNGIALRTALHGTNTSQNIM